MKNINKNRVSADLTPAQVAEIKDAISTVAGKMPFLVTLTEEERKQIVRVSSGNKDYAENAYSEAAANPGAMAASFSLVEMGKDIAGFNGLKEVLKALDDLVARVRDTQVLMGAEAYMAALSVYESLETAHRNGVEGAERARKNLSVRFKGQGNFKQGKGKDQ